MRWPEQAFSDDDLDRIAGLDVTFVHGLVHPEDAKRGVDHRPNRCIMLKPGRQPVLPKEYTPDA